MYREGKMMLVFVVIQFVNMEISVFLPMVVFLGTNN